MDLGWSDPHGDVPIGQTDNDLGLLSNTYEIAPPLVNISNETSLDCARGILWSPRFLLGEAAGSTSGVAGRIDNNPIRTPSSDNSEKSLLLLCPRQSKTSDFWLNSKIVLGCLKRYPQMLIEGLSLPPFIKAPCLGNDIACQDAGFHKCLPEPLATCASIIRILYTQDPGSKAFIWRSINLEQ